MFRNSKLAFLFAIGSVSTCISTARAEKNSPLEPKLAVLGSVVVSETFDSPLAAPFEGVKGDWKVVDGTLIGKELEADKHAAVLNLQKPNRNSIVRFSFKLDDATKGMSFSLNQAKGHLFRVSVTPTSLSVNLDKDKKDPQSKAIVMATAKGKFFPGQWHTIQVEMVGERVVVQSDNGLTVEASNAKLDIDKPNYRFVIQGETLSLDDLMVWEAK